MIVARSSGVAVVRRASSSSSEMSAPEPGQHVDGVVLDRPDVAQLLEVGADLGDPAEVRRTSRRRPRTRRSRAGSSRPARPTRSRRPGTPTAAGEPDGVVEQRPLVAGPGDQRDPVARLRRPRRRVPWPRRAPGRGTRAAVTSCHSLASRARRRARRRPRPGASAALRTTSSVRFPVAGTRRRGAGHGGGELAHALSFADRAARSGARLPSGPGADRLGSTSRTASERVELRLHDGSHG